MRAILSAVSLAVIVWAGAALRPPRRPAPDLDFRSCAEVEAGGRISILACSDCSFCVGKPNCYVASPRGYRPCHSQSGHLLW